MNPIALTLVLTLALPLAGHARYLVASHVVVTGERVTLANLVPDAPADWQQVALGRSPRPGGELVLAREWVLQRAQQVGAEDALELVDDVVVSRPGGEADRDAVIARGRPVLVLTRSLRRGDVIAPDDVEVRSGQSGSGGGYADPSQVVGKQLVRSLRAGSAPGPRDLESVTLVERGDMVRIVARVGGVVASTVGKSMETGGAGDLVRVENLQSGRQLTGVLQEGGVVEIAAGYRR